MSYLDKIEESKTRNVSVSEIWAETTEIEKEALMSCIEYFNSIGYVLTDAPDRYHPAYDLKFEYGSEDFVKEVTVECKREPRAGLERVRSETPADKRYDTSFVEYKDKTSRHPDNLTGLALTESDYYWFDNAEGQHLVPTNQVRRWGYEVDRREHVWGGINKTAFGFKCPVEWMSKYKINK